MFMREVDLDERLGQLGNIGNGAVFCCDTKTSRNAFHNKTVATLMRNPASARALLVFEQGIPRARE